MVFREFASVSFRPIADIRLRSHIDKMSINALESLVGEKLSGVGFIRDYIELYFDGPVLRLLGDVELQSASLGSKQSLESGLVELVGSAVNAIHEGNNAIKVEFAGGARVSLRAASYLSEYAHFITSHNNMIVWQTA